MLAVCPVFATYGYRSATIEQVVAAAQIGVGSFYSLFEGKQECFLYLYDAIVADAREKLAKVISQEASWPETVGEVLRKLLLMIAAEPLRARIVFVEAQTAGPTAEERYTETMAELARLLRRGRALRKQQAELPAGLEAATVAGVAWLIQQRLVAERAEDVPALLPEVAEIVLEPYLGHGEAAGAIERLLTTASV
ncbi:MAG: TetR/AcrR family transcriptional regulator [Solirubrobacterales bacterium]